MKKHSVNSRRQVSGRCKPFNELFKEYRDEKLTTSSSVPSKKSASKKPMSNSTPSEETVPNQSIADSSLSQIELCQFDSSVFDLQLNNPIQPISKPQQLQINSLSRELAESFVDFANISRFQMPEPSLPLGPILPPVDRHSIHPVSPMAPPSLVTKPQIEEPENISQMNFTPENFKLNLNFLNTMLVKHHPRPSAVTSFNARLTENGGGYTLWNRRQDNLRLALTNAFSQTKNFLPKNRSFTSHIESPIVFHPPQPPPVKEEPNLKYSTNKISKKRTISSSDLISNHSNATSVEIFESGQTPPTAKLSKLIDKNNCMFMSNTDNLINSNKIELNKKLANKNFNSITLDDFADSFLEDDDEGLQTNGTKSRPKYENGNNPFLNKMVKEKSVMLNGHGAKENPFNLMKYSSMESLMNQAPTLNQYLLEDDDDDDDDDEEDRNQMMKYSRSHHMGSTLASISTLPITSNHQTNKFIKLNNESNNGLILGTVGKNSSRQTNKSVTSLSSSSSSSTSSNSLSNNGLLLNSIN